MGRPFTLHPYHHSIPLDLRLACPMDYIIPFDWDVKTIFHASFPCVAAARTISPTSVRSSAMEDAMENLLVGEDDEGEDQEQWNTRLRPPEHDDSQDEGDG